MDAKGSDAHALREIAQRLACETAGMSYEHLTEFPRWCGVWCMDEEGDCRVRHGEIKIAAALQQPAKPAGEQGHAALVWLERMVEWDHMTWREYAAKYPDAAEYVDDEFKRLRDLALAAARGQR